MESGDNVNRQPIDQGEENPSMDASIVHPLAPPLPSHPSKVDAPVCHPPPPPFPYVPSIEVVTIEVSSEQVGQLSPPPVRDSPSRPEIFNVLMINFYVS
jgi:hypothetical protein